MALGQRRQLARRVESGALISTVPFTPALELALTRLFTDCTNCPAVMRCCRLPSPACATTRLPFMTTKCGSITMFPPLPPPTLAVISNWFSAMRSRAEGDVAVGVGCGGGDRGVVEIDRVAREQRDAARGLATVRARGDLRAVANADLFRTQLDAATGLLARGARADSHSIAEAQRVHRQYLDRAAAPRA